MGELATTGNQPLTLTQQLTVVTEQLAAASPDAIASHVMKLARAGLAYPPSIDTKKAGEIYAFALKGIPLEALKRSVMKIIQGEIPNISRDFIPTPPGLAALAKAEAAEMYRDRGRLLLALDSMQTGKPMPERDQSAVDRVRQMVAGVKMAAAAEREQERYGYRPQEPVSFEQAELYRRMLDLPDAKGGVSAEQMAYRRVIAGKIDTAEPPIPLQDEPVQGRYFLAQQQQEEMENHDSENQAKSGSQGEDRGDFYRGSEGQQERNGGDDGV